MNLPFIFQSPEFVYRDKSNSILSFEEDDCAIFFSKENKKITSLARSPFGSFSLPDNGRIKTIRSLVGKVLSHCKTNEIRSIEIKCYPEIYSTEKSEMINEVLTEAGFAIKYKDITQILKVDQELRLNRLRTRKLRQCEGAGFVFAELNSDKLGDAHELFAQSRKDKGYPVTMKLSDFKDEFSRFPSCYKLYGVSDGHVLIAAGVVITVNDEILYYFFGGHSQKYDDESPSTFLVYNLFQEARKKKIKRIDLGISTDKGELNLGLYNYKKSFGAFDSFKLTFEMNL